MEYVFIYAPMYLSSHMYLFKVTRKICIQVQTPIYIHKDTEPELAVFWTLSETKWFRQDTDKEQN